MRESNKISVSFCVITVILCCSAFILTWLNFIFSCGMPQRLETFKYIELLDYKKLIDYTFLVDLNFGSELMDTDDYGSINYTRNICYLGKCLINFKRKSTYNCSLSCLNDIKNCYDGENLCDTFECEEEYRWSDKNKACHEFNRIKIWKNTQIKKLNKTFEVIRYSDIIPNNGNCKSGYKKCGIINNDKDYLCLKEEYDCPINSVIIKPNNEAPDSDYKSYKLGENFIFFSNKKIKKKVLLPIFLLLQRMIKIL